MREGPRNRAALVATVHSLNEDDWVTHIVYLIKDNILPPEPFTTDIYKS
jgi:hypothetical protein